MSPFDLDDANQSIFAQPPSYHSYLLRFWEERSEQPAVWRFSLEDPQTTRRYGFASLDALVEWLRAQIDRPASHDNVIGSHEPDA